MAGEGEQGGTRGQEQRRPKCPVCGRPRAERFRPFCSARCRDRDLLNWFNGRYAVPAQEIEPDDPDESAG